MYLVIEGMPGTGKTTLAKALAYRIDAIYMKSIFSNTDIGGKFRTILNAGLYKELEPFYIIDLLFDELRLQNYLKDRNVVRDKVYASSLAHIRVHGLKSEGCVSSALYDAYMELKSVTIEPDYVIYINPIMDKVIEHIYQKSDLSDIDLELIGDQSIYLAQEAELKKDLRDKYGEKVIYVDSYSGTVDEMTDRIMKIIKLEV